MISINYRQDEVNVDVKIVLMCHRIISILFLKR